MDAGFAVGGAQADGQRARAILLREEVVDDLEVAWFDGLQDLVDFFLDAVDEFLNLDLGGGLFWRPVDARYVGAEVEAQVAGIAKKGGYGEGVLPVEQKRVLLRRAGIGD